MRLIDEVQAHGGAHQLGGEMLLTHTFDDPLHGLSLPRYRAVLERSVFTLAPEGVHADTYRASEALAAASIPIVACDSSFQGLWGEEHPVPCVNDWTWRDLQAVFAAAEQEGHAAMRRRVLVWWHGYLRNLSETVAKVVLSREVPPRGEEGDDEVEW
ncbi:hypothetical protein T484DRAFT_1939682 [Baffinella frigidus]|nr:hypothetical protein T484DRAFT_1939682 [Cryptophyta sp. CCMP2293]